MSVSDFHHDPDWEPGGKITLFSNNSRALKDTSDIVTIDYGAMEDHLDVDGARYEFFSDANGRHQLTPYGNRFVTSSKQGWAFEKDSEGRIVFSFVNTAKDGEQRALHLAEAWRFDEEYFDIEFWNECGT